MRPSQIFAHAGHDSINHVRKYTGEPYWVHTDEVADLVGFYGGDEDMVPAADLHDLIEDVFPKNPAFSESSILTRFGARVAAIVMDLTDVYTSEAFPKLNRARRKQMEAERLGDCCADAQSVKLCDLISNSRNILAHDPGFAVTYLREKEVLLKYMQRGNRSAWEKAASFIPKVI